MGNGHVWHSKRRYLWVCDVVDQHTGVSATVERHAQALEALLAGCIPDLRSHMRIIVSTRQEVRRQSHA